MRNTVNRMLFLAVLMGPTLAFAQTTAPVAAPAAVPAQHKPVDFAKRKANALDHISKRNEELQKRQQCVQAAGTNEALDACKPKRVEHKKK